MAAPGSQARDRMMSLADRADTLALLRREAVPACPEDR
jgi:hypothetical protein